jgi:hypothetical protein
MASHSCAQDHFNKWNDNAKKRIGKNHAYVENVTFVEYFKHEYSSNYGKRPAEGPSGFGGMYVPGKKKVCENVRDTLNEIFTSKEKPPAWLCTPTCVNKFSRKGKCHKKRRRDRRIRVLRDDDDKYVPAPDFDPHKRYDLKSPGTYLRGTAVFAHPYVTVGTDFKSGLEHPRSETRVVGLDSTECECEEWRDSQLTYGEPPPNDNEDVAPTFDNVTTYNDTKCTTTDGGSDHPCCHITVNEKEVWNSTCCKNLDGTWHLPCIVGEWKKKRADDKWEEESIRMGADDRGKLQLSHIWMHKSKRFVKEITQDRYLPQKAFSCHQITDDISTHHLPEDSKSCLHLCHKSVRTLRALGEIGRMEESDAYTPFYVACGLLMPLMFCVILSCMDTEKDEEERQGECCSVGPQYKFSSFVKHEDFDDIVAQNELEGKGQENGSCFTWEAFVIVSKTFDWCSDWAMYGISLQSPRFVETGQMGVHLDNTFKHVQRASLVFCLFGTVLLCVDIYAKWKPDNLMFEKLKGKVGFLVIFFEDLPQLIICGVYLKNVEFNASDDKLTILSIVLSGLSLLYNIVYATKHVRSGGKLDAFAKHFGLKGKALMHKIESEGGMDTLQVVVDREKETEALETKMSESQAAKARSRSMRGPRGGQRLANTHSSEVIEEDPYAAPVEAEEQPVAEPVVSKSNRSRTPSASGRICSQKTRNGPCTSLALSGSKYCDNHTCKHHGCNNNKSSTVANCKTHTTKPVAVIRVEVERFEGFGGGESTTGEMGEYMDVNDMMPMDVTHL